jgi:hypothetical protein
MAVFTSNPTFGLPSRLLKLVKGQRALPDETWYQFLVRLAQLSAERPIAPVSVGVSPFVYTAFTIGHIFVAGGTVSAISLGPLRRGAGVSRPTSSSRLRPTTP